MQGNTCFRLCQLHADLFLKVVPVIWAPYDERAEAAAADRLKTQYVASLRDLAPDTGCYVNEVCSFKAAKVQTSQSRLGTDVSRPMLTNRNLQKHSGVRTMQGSWKSSANTTQTGYFTVRIAWVQKIWSLQMIRTCVKGDKLGAVSGGSSISSQTLPNQAYICALENGSH